MRAPVQHWNDVGTTPQPKAALESGDLQAALSGFATLHLLNYRMHMRVCSDVHISGFGVALWLLGDRLGAATVWSRVCDEALKGKYTYSSTGTFQGGLLLWFASVWLKDEEMTRRLWMEAKDPDYPQAELEYYLLAHEKKKLGI